MKRYEMVEAKRKFMPLLPIIVRIDGKCFHNWTDNLDRPFDSRLHCIMMETTAALVRATGAVVGYTQSDEISLILYSGDYKSQVYFDGRISKIVSVIASIATCSFNHLVQSWIPENAGLHAYFDTRAWQVPNKIEATNTILWRENDCTKNSLQMLARHYFSHKQLHGLGRAQIHELLHAEGVNSCPTWFKRGSYVRGGDIEELNLPPLATIANRVEVLFDGAYPAILGVDDERRDEGRCDKGRSEKTSHRAMGSGPEERRVPASEERALF